MTHTRHGYVRPVDFKHGVVEMSHGGGGRAMAQLIDELFLREFDNPVLAELSDQARLDLPPGKVVMATDSHVIAPLFFPGGDIGCLAVHGTLNDLAAAGARPLYLSAAFILEEGFALADLKRIVVSMAKAARDANVSIVTGDTKVVEKGKGDGVFITTTGVGVVPVGVDVRVQRVAPGDRIIVTGPMGDHGVAVMSQRDGLGFFTDLVSDTAALHELVAALIAEVPGVHMMRDPTRGGLGAVLNEIARQAQVGIVIDEAAIPVKPAVNAACELLGLDPIYVANEGKMVVFCANGDAERALGALRNHHLGREASIIGEVIEDANCFVQMTTAFGGRRMVDWISGEQLPRIC